MTKQLLLLSSVKISEKFFEIFVAFSEKLDFNQQLDFIFRSEFPFLNFESMIQDWALAASWERKEIYRENVYIAGKKEEIEKSSNCIRLDRSIPDAYTKI